MVYQSLSTLSSLDFSAFSPNGEIVRCLEPRMRAVKSVTIDCLQLDDSSIVSILGPHLEELNLLKCTSLSYHVLPSIGEKCPNLWFLVLELAGKGAPEILRTNLAKMLLNLIYLRYLVVKVRGTGTDAYGLAFLVPFIPKTLIFLKMQPVDERDAVHYLDTLGDGRGSCRFLTHLSIVRNRANYPTSFKRINDGGVLVMAESCQGLESVRLGGFSRVTDARFSSLVHSCRKLKKLEIWNAPQLSDFLAFHDMVGALSSG